MAERKEKKVRGNVKNLIPVSSRTSEELREMTRKGGIASGEARRRKKMMKDVLEKILFDVEPPEAWRQKLLDEGVDEKDISHQMIVTMGLVKKAESGDVFAYQTICQMLGEKPSDKLELSGGLDNKIEIGFVETDVEPKNDERDVDV